MIHRTYMRAALFGLSCLAWSLDARAEPLFHWSGKVALADGAVPEGTRAKLQVDLNRNGKLEGFETLQGSVGAGGAYKLTYDLKPSDVDLEFITFATKLVAEYRARGFQALLDQGPLPVVLSFERQGYATVVKRISSMFEAPSLDVVLAPLRDIQCTEESCLAADGAVRFGKFPGGTKIARAYASAYDPAHDHARFPGNFADDAKNLLISSGFSEINLYDADGNAIHQVSEPVATRFEAQRSSWKTLPDLQPNSGRIELPMYSFDQGKGQWVREDDGELQWEDGTAVPERDLAAIHSGKYDKKIFVAFETLHFSSFNCDAPIERRACVKGRLVDAAGKAQGGLQVSIHGESYTGTAGTVFTGADGYFASDLMKSEKSGEDVDGNGKEGETFTARVSVQGAAGVFVGESFDTPKTTGSVLADYGMSCKPKDCECVDMGDVEVKFEPPRLCEVTVEATFSGTDLTGTAGPIRKGDAVVGAQVRGELAGSVSIPQAAITKVCDGKECNTGTVGEDGMVTLVVPVIGDAPQIQVHADFHTQSGDTLHYYTGQLSVQGCTGKETSLTTPLSLELNHAAVGDLGSYIEKLGAGTSGDKSGPGLKDPFGCGCRVGATPAGARWAWSAAALLCVGLVLRRRRRRG